MNTVQTPIKTGSKFFPSLIRVWLHANIARQSHAGEIAAGIVDSAQPWILMSEEQLWALMFGPAITRSWMVWSDGHCPACTKSVPMYNWQTNALNRPWKIRCPHCAAVFPTNDFAAFHQSGLDEHGVFDPKRADRTLLFNCEHPDPADPLYSFGVDDGEGFVQNGNRWRFIGAYLIYGQWKQAVLGGIQALSRAYLATGESVYARKAAILLDRVADLYPYFDFGNQGRVYEDHHLQGRKGYVSVWHDACEETREMALAYDMIFDSIKDDPKLPAFLARKARQYKLQNRKTSFNDVQKNIEKGILLDPLANPQKIHSNYPRQDITLILIRAILDLPRDDTDRLIKTMLERATAVDGVTGEKGLVNYSASVIQAMAEFLALWDRAEEDFLQCYLENHPRLHLTYRFHIDTWCLGKFYPLIGDTGWFGRNFRSYCGVAFRHPGSREKYGSDQCPPVDTSLAPSMYSFLWKIYQLTGDTAFAQVLYLANGNTVDGLPHDMFASGEQGMRDGVTKVIAEKGSIPEVGCVNKEQWCLAILRSGEGENARASWLNYAVGGGHHHQDGMNLGLFAYDLDLMPELGYPPVQFGGWNSRRALWYKKKCRPQHRGSGWSGPCRSLGKNHPLGRRADTQGYPRDRSRHGTRNSGKREKQAVRENYRPGGRP